MTTYHPGDKFRRIRAGVATSRRSNHALDGRIHTVDRLQSGSNTDVIDTDGTAHWGSNIELVERASAIAPATVEQVQEIVARANAQVPELRAGDRVRRNEQAPTHSGRYSTTDREPFVIARTHSTTHNRQEAMCAVDPEEGHHIFHNLEPAPAIVIHHGARQPAMGNPQGIRAGDTVRRITGGNWAGYSHGDQFVVRRVGEWTSVLAAYDPNDNPHLLTSLELVPEQRIVDATVAPAEPLTVPANWGSMELWEQELLNPFQVGDIVRRKPGTGSSETDFTIQELGADGRHLAARMTTTGDEWHHVVNLVLQRRPEPATLETNNTPTTEGTIVTESTISAPYEPQAGDIVTVSSIDGGPNYRLLRPLTGTSGSRAQWSIMRLNEDGTDDYDTWHWGDDFTKVTPARTPGVHGIAPGDTVRTRENYVQPSYSNKRRDQTPWVVVSLDDDGWPVDENGAYYVPAHVEIVAEAGTVPVPTTEERIEINDPRIAWFWTAAAEAAREEGFCNEYERMARRLGVPGRLQKFRITAEMRGALAGILSLEVEAEDARAARGQMIDALGGRNTAEKFRITVNSI